MLRIWENNALNISSIGYSTFMYVENCTDMYGINIHIDVLTSIISTEGAMQQWILISFFQLLIIRHFISYLKIVFHFSVIILTIKCIFKQLYYNNNNFYNWNVRYT